MTANLRSPGFASLGLAAIVAVAYACSSQESEPAAPASEGMNPLRLAAIAECKKSIATRTAEFRNQIALKHPLQAVEAMGMCASLTGNTELESEVRATHIEGLTAAASNKRASATERMRTFEVLERLYPDAAARLSKMKQEIEQTAGTELAKSKAAQSKADAARKRREGVTIGMSEQDVLDSAWGRPRKINRTTRASGTSEQWVYDGGYLYFDNGVLTAIQN